MKIYQCSNCAYPVYFENVICSNCNSWLGYLDTQDRMIALTPGQQNWSIQEAGGHTHQYCNNHQHSVCNWLIPVEDPTGLCDACDLNHTIPNLNDLTKVKEWRALEKAKHRLVYALRRFGLPIEAKMKPTDRGLAFDFLSADDAEEPVMTGHDDGLITLNTKEANPATREATRMEMHERYRTLIGHFRHEVGHYYWDVLIVDNPRNLEEFRRLFGDEREDYGEALKQHYKQGPPADWQQNYISKYATTHAWEDWAEVWAHYLHIIDMIETAYAFGMSVNPSVGNAETMQVTVDFDPYEEQDIERIIKACVPLTFAVNSLNRGMGRPDLYPFIINPSVREKLTFVHRVIRST